MANQSGIMYGLTILSPILNDESAVPSHDLQLREYLASLSVGEDAPFARAPYTHICRLVVMDDVIYVGMPSCEEHLKSKYLIFESNFDGDLETYLVGLARSVPTEIDAIWRHCVGYPGVQDVAAFVRYMKACQVETTFYFAATNDKTLPQTLEALQTQRLVGDFISQHQGLGPAELQRSFAAFVQELRSMPVPRPGSGAVMRGMKTGGHNE